jgi:hypothetical protein
MRRQRAGTEDSVYPSEEYMRTLSGRVRDEAGVGAGAGGGAKYGAGEVNERVRAAGIVVNAGGGILEFEVEVAVDEEVPGKAGKDGMKEETEDQRRVDEEATAFGAALELAGGGGGGTVGAGGTRMTGFSHFSKNLMTGSSADMFGWLFAGELGNGRWMTALAFGGGRGGMVYSSPLCSLCSRFFKHRSAHMTSNIPKCSSAARRCAAVGNGARSWHSTHISYPYPCAGLLVGI